MSDEDRKLGWWTMSGRAFMDALQRAHAGEDPETVYLEYYVNSDIESNKND